MEAPRPFLCMPNTISGSYIFYKTSVKLRTLFNIQVYISPYIARKITFFSRTLSYWTYLRTWNTYWNESSNITNINIFLLSSSIRPAKTGSCGQGEVSSERPVCPSQKTETAEQWSQHVKRLAKLDFGFMRQTNRAKILFVRSQKKRRVNSLKRLLNK